MSVFALRLLARDGVGTHHMGHRLIAALREQRDFSHGQRFSHFHEFANANDGFAGGRFSQEIDGQAGGDCHRDDADFSQNGHIQRNVGNRHEHRARHSAAGSQIGRADLKFDGRAFAADL